jgi:hypothetical protein
MTYETVVADLFNRLPRLRLLSETKFPDLRTQDLGAYPVFGSVLIPALEQALSAGDLGTILPICAFLEDVAEAAEKDKDLKSLLRLEVGKWLGWVENEASLAPWLGSKTKLICRYVPGLATQRLALREEESKRSIKKRIGSMISRRRTKR